MRAIRYKVSEWRSYVVISRMESQSAMRAIRYKDSYYRNRYASIRERSQSAMRAIRYKVYEMAGVEPASKVAIRYACNKI